MRRWFLTFLSLVMIAQFSWAAAVACCADELKGGMVSSHAQSGQSLVDEEQVSGSLADHLQQFGDAGHCHCHHVYAASGSDVGLGAGTHVQAVPNTDLPCLVKSHIPHGLDRPNWLRA